MRVGFFECFSLTYNETCSGGDTGAGDENVTELVYGSNGHLQGSMESAEALAQLFTIRMLVECMFSQDDNFAQTDGDVSGTQVPATAARYLRQRAELELSNHQGSGRKTIWQHPMVRVGY